MLVFSLRLILAAVASAPLAAVAISSEPTSVGYRIQLDVISEGYTADRCWFHPRAGAIPGTPTVVVLTMQELNLRRSDVFYPIASRQTADLGASWSPIAVQRETLGRRPLGESREEAICDFTPKWHAASGRLVATGHTVVYEHDRLVAVRPRHTAWSVYDPAGGAWTPWEKMAMPDEPRFANAGAGSTQRVDLPNGDILLPVYAKEPAAATYLSTVVRARFDGRALRYLEHGTEMSVQNGRGLYEPSLARFGGHFFLTLRNDQSAYVARGTDGLHFEAPKSWTFDDGTEVGSYNTQAHWVTHADGLFLVYTRRAADNDQVMRHRAPLFIARVDPERLVLLRASERVLVPNRGAQLGNFAVVDVSEHETWVTTSEGMSPGDPARFGANGRVYAARIIWERPNTAWNRH